MTAIERADAIIKDILVNHLPRIKEGLEKGYVDENQILVVYDHAVRARLLKELADYLNKEVGEILAKLVPHHEDALDRLNAELDQEVASEMEPQPVKNFGDKTVDPTAYNLNLFVHPGERAQDHRAMHGTAPGPEGPKGPEGPRGRTKDVVMLDEANWRPTKTVYECVCGGHIAFKQTAPEGLFVCDSCKLWYNCESEVEAALREHKTKQPAQEPICVGFTLEGKKHQSDRLVMTGADLRYLAPQEHKDYSLFMESRQGPDVQIKDDDQVSVMGQSFYLVPAASFGMTGTIAHGVAQTTGVGYLLNGQEAQFVYTAENKACISYEEIVVRTMAQEKKITSEDFLAWMSRNAEHPLWSKTLPNYTVVYKYDRVPPSGILRGSVFKGERLYVAPGLRINAMLTGNA